MLSAGDVTYIGRKYSSLWTLAGHPAAVLYDPFDALGAVWPAYRPHPRGGGESAPPAHALVSVTPSKFFGA